MLHPPAGVGVLLTLSEADRSDGTCLQCANGLCVQMAYLDCTLCIPNIRGLRHTIGTDICGVCVVGIPSGVHVGRLGIPSLLEVVV